MKSMEFICAREHKGLKTKFYVLPKTKKFLEKRGIKLKKCVPKPEEWYEEILSDLVEGRSEKNFKVVFHGIMDKDVEQEPAGFVEGFEFDESKLLDNSYLHVSSKQEEPLLAIKQKVLVD